MLPVILWLIVLLQLVLLPMAVINGDRLTILVPCFIVSLVCAIAVTWMRRSY